MDTPESYHSHSKPSAPGPDYRLPVSEWQTFLSEGQRVLREFILDPTTPEETLSLLYKAVLTQHSDTLTEWVFGPGSTKQEIVGNFSSYYRPRLVYPSFTDKDLATPRARANVAEIVGKFSPYRVGEALLRLMGYLKLDWNNWERKEELEKDVYLMSFRKDLFDYMHNAGWQWYYFGFFETDYVDKLKLPISPEIFESLATLPLDIDETMLSAYRETHHLSVDGLMKGLKFQAHDPDEYGFAYFASQRRRIPELLRLSIEKYCEDHPQWYENEQEKVNLRELLEASPIISNDMSWRAGKLIREGVFKNVPPDNFRHPVIWSRRKILDAIEASGIASTDSVTKAPLGTLPKELLGTPVNMLYRDVRMQSQAGREFSLKYVSYYYQMLYRHLFGTLRNIDWSKACAQGLVSEEKLRKVAEEMGLEVPSTSSYEELCARVSAASSERRNIMKELKTLITPEQLEEFRLRPGSVYVGERIESEQYKLSPTLSPQLQNLLFHCENLGKLPQPQIIEILTQLGLEKYLPSDPTTLTVERACTILKNYIKALESAYPPYYERLEMARERPPVYEGEVPSLEKLK